MLTNIKKMSGFCLGTLILLSMTFMSAGAQDNANAVVNDFLNIYNTSTGKVAQLADAIPDDKYDWRPAEGIRSVKEAVLHVTSANYYFASMIGGQIPEGVDPRSFEQSGMSKSESISALKESVTFVQNTVKNMTEKELNTKIDFFGNQATKRQVMFTLGDHAAEHLGQLIAYARMNEVTPPWSE